MPGVTRRDGVDGADPLRRQLGEQRVGRRLQEQPDTDDGSRFNAVGPGYFKTFGVPLLAGRDFTASDASTAPKVAIVNEAFAKKFNLGRQVVGKHMSVGNDSLNIEIVGLAKDSKYASVKDKIPPVF